MLGRGYHYFHNFSTSLRDLRVVRFEAGHGLECVAGVGAYSSRLESRGGARERKRDSFKSSVVHFDYYYTFSTQRLLN